MSALALIILSSCAFAALALGMDRHWDQVSKRSLASRQRKMLRFAGWVLLAAALSAGVIGWGASIGIVAWLGVSSVVGLALVFALPKFSHPLARRSEGAMQPAPTSFAASTGRMRLIQWLAAFALVVTTIAFAWHIRAAYLKVNKPSSTREAGMKVEGELRERSTAVQLPSNLSGDQELWLTVEGNDHAVLSPLLSNHQSSNPRIAFDRNSTHRATGAPTRPMTALR